MYDESNFKTVNNPASLTGSSAILETDPINC